MGRQQGAQKTLRKKPPTRRPPVRRCTCSVELKEDEPIAVATTGGTSVAYAPQYTTEPKCEPGNCQKNVSWEWAISDIENAGTPPPTLVNADQEMVSVRGSGEFKLCVKVKVKCMIPLTAEVSRLTKCEDSGCDSFVQRLR